MGNNSDRRDITVETRELLALLGVDDTASNGTDSKVMSPVTGDVIGVVDTTSDAQVQEIIAKAHGAFLTWRNVPAPKRGELVRLLGEELRTHKETLGRLVSIEVGKTISEGQGEVQEMIDICDFAVGLSRQLHGFTIASERKQHRMMETWHPLGVVGVISAFNFPVAVWAWNSALAFVCGDSVVWKPSEKAPLSALACQALFLKAANTFGSAPAALSSLLMGGATVGEALVTNPTVPLVSATGSTAMGRKVAPLIAQRFGSAILELGGNNAGIVCPSADQEMTLQAVAFGAMGTAGQRCTTMRRLFVHKDIYDTFVPRLKKAYQVVSVGNPLTSNALVGPLIDKDAFDMMTNALKEATLLGGVVTGGQRVETDNQDTWYVRPALVEMATHDGIVLEETFAPILYVMKYSELDEAIAMHNAVAAGLSSSIFTKDIQEAELFLASSGSDCGIANVNIGTSGAEIGGAFGGNKDTGGGRESGSTVWKSYMRRATNTINYSNDIPLAQGVTFEI